MENSASQPGFDRPSGLWREPHLWLLALLAASSYLVRLDALPIRGEEPRGARVACEMLQSGDWIVPRQQGEVYLSRPPLGNWLIAAGGYFRGQVDVIAVRLPSSLATVLTTLLIYAYCRSWLSRLGSFAAGAAFTTSVMVIELGRLGETEAVFTCCVSASLLLWHWGYQRGWHPAIAWCSGYLFAALSGLAKGPQGPVYFVAPVAAYLLLRRDGRWLLSRWHLCGLLTFAAVLSLWQIPFALATDWASVRGIWLSNAAERFDDARLSSLGKHLLTYPLELFCCLLPWSLPLTYLTNRRFWKSLDDVRPWIVFLLVAIGVCFPSVWFATGAKGRYFMPLFPCFAILTGLVIERCWRLDPACAPRRAWNLFLAAAAILATAAGASVAAASWLKAGLLARLEQPPPLAAAYLLLALATAWCLWAARSKNGSRFAVASLASLMLLLAGTSAGVATNIRAALSDDTAAQIARLKDQLPPEAHLVSLGQISHLFAFHYGGLIPTTEWPSDTRPLAAGIEYFCFNQLDYESYDFPFAWERIAVISLDRLRRPVPERTVIVARRLNGESLASAEER